MCINNNNNYFSLAPRQGNKKTLMISYNLRNIMYIRYTPIYIIYYNVILYCKLIKKTIKQQ